MWCQFTQVLIIDSFQRLRIDYYLFYIQKQEISFSTEIKGGFEIF